MKDFTTISSNAYKEHLELRYNLYIADRIAKVTVFLIILAILFIDWLRYIGE